MEAESHKFPDLRVKHLEMLQSVIARMAGQGATLKNYCITLTTAICGFSITLERPLVGLLAFLILTIFALLDAQYLRLERRFRCIYERVRSEDWAAHPTFEISPKDTPTISYWCALGSWSILIFYAPLAAAVAVVVLVARTVYV
jgi:hypothetical protein